MDIPHACIGAQWLNTKNVIPMHYNTFPQIETNIDGFKLGIEKLGMNPVVMKIEESIEI